MAKYGSIIDPKLSLEIPRKNILIGPKRFSLIINSNTKSFLICQKYIFFRQTAIIIVCSELDFGGIL
jgi:hypothetical protein